MEISGILVSFRRLPLVVTALCCLVTGVLVLGLRLLPTPPKPSLLARNPCALPCFFGVFVGETTRDQAIDILNQIVDVTNVSETLLTFPLVDAVGRAALASIVNDENGLVESARLISIDAAPHLAQLGDLLLAGQTPAEVFRTCADMDHVRFLITFGADEALLVELFPNGKLTPITPITLIDIARPGQRSLMDARSSFGCSVETRWYGFAPLWKYFRVGVF